MHIIVIISNCNYKGITLTILSKIFSTLPDTRIGTWAEENNLMVTKQPHLLQRKNLHQKGCHQAITEDRRLITIVSAEQNTCTENTG